MVSSHRLRQRDPMIKSEVQYQRARKQLGKWFAMKRRLSSLAFAFSVEESELLEVAEIKIASLQQEIANYRALTRSNAIDIEQLQGFANFPGSLISARIALGWTQTELAERTGLRAQHIHRYEKERYSSISLSRALKIAAILQASLSEREAAHKELECLLPDKMLQRFTSGSGSSSSLLDDAPFPARP